MTAAACLITVMLAGQVDPLAHLQTLNQGLDNPARLAVKGSEVLVADTRANRIARFDLAGAPRGSWSEPAGPVGVAVHLDGRVFVSRRDDLRVAVYDAAFTFQHFLADGVVDFIRPTDMTVDDLTGRLYVVDSGADRLYVFDAAESVVLMLGVRGDGPSEFKYPSAIAVDGANARMFVADQENFRIQVFSLGGIFQRSFGYRIKYLADGTSEGWMPRTTGLAVDGAGRLYVTDAVMGTLRLFSPSGAEIGKLAGFGSAPGELRNPGDVAVGLTGQVYVANGTAGTVEIYASNAALRTAVSGQHYRGSNASDYDIARQLSARGILLGDLSARSLQHFLRRKGGSADVRTAATNPDWEAPHMLDDTICGRCHSINSQPGGHEGTLAGQENLCLSCHTGAGQALASALRPADRGDVGGAPPTGGGRSHAWGVSAVNAAAGSVGPPAGGQMERYLSDGLIKCATCHNQHNSQAGSPFLRVSNADGALCRGCHVDHIGHTPAGSWQPTCVDCHDTHNPSSSNISLVATSIHNRTLDVDKSVVFTAVSGPNSFDDGDPAANDGICQVCHTATAYHTHDGTGAAHNDGQDCTGCHPHEAGFMAAGGDCTSCHATVQDNGDGLPAGGRRGVTGEFPVDDAHAHYGAALDSSACVVCHDQETHMDGYVDLFDPDGGATFRFVTAADLTGDPDLSDFCAGCHDADGATRMATPMDPFGNGNSPPDVAAKFQGTLQWEEMYGGFCFATEGTMRQTNSHHDISDADQAFSGAKIECLNCHGAHNASAAQPTADPFDTTTAWAGDANGFCLACHNGGTGPLDPGFPPGVFGPVIDVTDPRWASLGMDWSTILGGACQTQDCSSLRGIDSCDYVEGPWYVDFSWTHSSHGLESKRDWDGYSGAPDADMDCVVCHDPHGSYSPANPAGNPYMIRDFVDGTAFVDDGPRTGPGFNGPPWETFGTARDVTVDVSGTTVDWGGPTSLCSACHSNWLDAYSWHAYCGGCQTCHAHGAAFGESDFVGTRDDTPCPLPAAAPRAAEPYPQEEGRTAPTYDGGPTMPLHRIDGTR